MTTGKNKGFSLVELMIVIAIIGIGLGAATLNFSQWIKKTNIEKQTRELFGDLNEARLKSIYMKKRHSIVVYTNSYVFKEYSSENENRFAGKTIYTKNTAYQMTTKTGASVADGPVVEFDIRGFTVVPSNNTFRINPVNSGAAFDCVIISDSRTNLGQMGSGNVCNQK